MHRSPANGARDIVQPMVFDYYDRTTTDMGTAAINAVSGLRTYLQGLLPGKTDAQYWSMIGLTIMNGIDDYSKQTEVPPARCPRCSSSDRPS